MHTKEEKMEAFGRLLDVLDELRVKCPWDRKQTNESLRPNTIEEVYELCDALMKDDKKDICKELTRRISVRNWVMSCCMSFFMRKSAAKPAILISRMCVTNCATS